MSTDIGLSRKQRVFVVAETTAGTLAFPSDSDLIMPAGNATLNQTPDFVDSEELKDSLDIMDQFVNARPPGEWSISMYIRPGLTLGAEPQGGPLFECVQGEKATITIALAAALDDSETTVTFDTLAGGRLPKRGVITVDSEDILYTGLTMATSTTGSLTGCTRAYDGSTAAAHTDETAASLSCVFYRQKTSSTSFSIWIITDHLMQGLSGATSNELSLEINNEGAVKADFKGQGMEMVWAGTGALAADASSVTDITVDDGKLYSVGSFIWNVTTEDDNTSAGYEITAVTSNVLTLGTAFSGSEDDVIAGFLPAGTIKSSPIESKNTSVLMDGVTAKFRSSTLTLSAPKDYLTDEVGTEYPEEYVEGVRSIKSNLNLYFKKADARYISDGYTSNEFVLILTFGTTEGEIMEIIAPKSRTSPPEIGADGPTMTLSMEMTALGTVGEDSIDLIFR